MCAAPRRRRSRKRVGRVSYFFHHGAWHLYYREGRRQIRRRVGLEEAAAARAAAEVNAQLANELPGMFSFEPISVAELQRRFLDHHEHVVQSSLATVQRYRSATQHLVQFSQVARTGPQAHRLQADEFLRHLRQIRISPNGHRNSKTRSLRDKGIRFILETCRSLFGFASKKRHLPPYSENPFAGLGGQRNWIDDAKPVFVFDAASELEFLSHANRWSFPIHFCFAKTGLRPGELVHLLIDDLDLAGGWLTVRNKPEIGWRVKTRRQRKVPLIEELALVLRRLVGSRHAGPVFLRPRAGLQSAPLSTASYQALADEAQRRTFELEESKGQPPSREEVAQVHRTIWRDAGAIRAEEIRKSFLQIAADCNFKDATCPKSWRHTFATLLQDGNVDVLVRQITLGHVSALNTNTNGALGMTATYTHTRPETQRTEVFRALRLWPKSLLLARNYAQGGAHD